MFRDTIDAFTIHVAGTCPEGTTVHPVQQGLKQTPTIKPVMYLSIEIQRSPDTLLSSRLPVLLDFYADWCAPCHSISPALTELAHEFDGKMSLAKVDVDAKLNSPLIEKFAVYSIPTVIFIKNGHEINRITGAKPKDQYRAAVNEVLEQE